MARSAPELNRQSPGKVMNRADLTKRLVGKLAHEEAVIGGIGNTNFDLFAAGHRPQNFYMLGSMGLACPIALGVALAQPQRGVIALEGDGSILMALGCLATVLWMLADAWWFQANAERRWADGLAARTAAASAPRRQGARGVPPGSLLGLLAIPRLDLSVVVAEGTSVRVLQHAVGHLSSSAAPGVDGNVVLAGHRDTFFRPLEAIRRGDRIELDDGARVHDYRVEWIEIVDPDRLDVVAPSRDSTLTLITCYPFRFVGAAPQRFVVRARELELGERREAESRSDPPGG